MKNITEKLFYYLIPILFLFPLFKESIVTFLFILLSLNTLFYCISHKKGLPNLKKWGYFTIPFWIVFFTCLIYYKNPDDLLPIKNALFFALFPIVFLLIPLVHFTKEKVNLYLTIFKNTCLIIAIGYIGAFLYYYDFSDFFVFQYGIPKFRDFVYYEVPFFKIHPTYYTAFLMLCCAFSLEKILKEKKYIEIIYLLVFILITFLLLTKINIVFLIVLLFLMLFFRSTLSVKQKITSSLILFIATSFLIVSVPGIKNRFAEMYHKFNDPPKGLDYSSTNVRVAIYKCCWNIAEEHYLWGVGFSKIGNELLECYQSNYDSGFYEKKGYLSHNYFYYIFLSSGIFGLILYLFYLYKIATICFRINSFLLNICMVNILILCFSEDFFYRQYGLVFFSLVFYTFYNSYRESKPS